MTTTRTDEQLCLAFRDGGDPGALDERAGEAGRGYRRSVLALSTDRIVRFMEETYPHRVVLGVLFFGTLGLLDWRRHPENPKRAKEYLFLIGAMALAVIYGVLHDHVTATISPEYFLKGKELELDPRPFRWAVTVLAAHAAYGPGLVVGAALLIANNPSATRGQLSYRELGRLALVPLVLAATAAALGGVLSGALDVAGRRPDAELLAGKEAATRFLVTWGVHAGSYAGGGLGALLACVLIRRRRPSASARASESDARPA